ncbi:MAG: sulfoxide reductase heme-binding subunit YedZ [Oleiphilus sp.]|nr:MAG: sulfoxide reductase heme-binding subunit YedZ [Oleiphilus sp.]
MRGFYKSAFAWCLVFFSCLLPLSYIIVRALWGDLGAEPAKVVVEFLGETALILLFCVLSLSPSRKVEVLSGLNRFRRMLGLYVFFYALLHLLAYATLLVDWQNFLEDLYQRLYVTVGFAAFLILLVLSITSPKAMVKKLGRKWKSVHRMVYLALALVLVHVLWQTRSDYGEVVIYALMAFVLLSFRSSYFKSLLITRR